MTQSERSNLPLPSFKVSWIVMVDKSQWKISTSSVVKDDELSSPT